jgi:hypothetical protein
VTAVGLDAEVGPSIIIEVASTLAVIKNIMAVFLLK